MVVVDNCNALEDVFELREGLSYSSDSRDDNSVNFDVDSRV